MDMIRVMLIVLLLVPAWSFAQDDEGTKEPSLAELARRERERRAQLEEVPLITNATLKRMGGGRVSTAAGPATETEPTEGEEGAEENGSEKAEGDPEVWEGRFDESRLNLKNAVNRDLVLQLKMNDLRNQYLSGSSSSQSRIQQQLLETQQEIEKNQQDVKSARQSLDTLQDEAQKEGVPDDTIIGLVGELPPDTSITPRPDQ
ncbi:hypothetical protein KAJ77_07980 [bacterium]|nr:hypothetical protein [bacterium]